MKLYLTANKSKLQEAGTFKVADLGCADAKNDLATLKAIIELVKEITPGVSILFYMNDMPQTDASTIMANVDALK